MAIPDLSVESRRAGPQLWLGIRILLFTMLCLGCNSPKSASRDVQARDKIFVEEYSLLWRELGLPAPVPPQPGVLDLNNLDAAAEIEGERLSVAYCGACHVRPEPHDLNRKAWFVSFSAIIPIMAGRGLLDFEIPPKPERHSEGVLPMVPGRRDMWAKPYAGFQLSQNDFAKIAYYYFAGAAAGNLPQAGKPAASHEPAPFKKKIARDYTPPKIELYCMAFVDENLKRIIIADVESRSLIFMNAEGIESQRVGLGGIPIHITKHAGYYYITLMGPSMYQGDWQSGQVVRMRAVGGLGKPRVEKVLSNLERPVMTTFADLENNGQPGLLVAEFGLFSGSLSWYKPAAAGRFKKRRIYDGSGVMTVALHDFDHDGKLDIVAPVSQEVESVSIFQNRDFGAFVTSQVMKKHPAYGLNSMLLADLDQDGSADIVTVNGDDPGPNNATRNYHGVRAYINDGKGAFSEKMIYPMFGALLLVARDFDLDGDEDLVVISHYPDLDGNPPETLVYLENKGGLQFVPHRFDGGNQGRWMALAAGDIDGDGDSDIVVAAAELPLGDMEAWDQAFQRSARPGFAIFENMTRSVSKR